MPPQQLPWALSIPHLALPSAKNARPAHWAQRHRATKAIRELVFFSLRAAWLGSMPPEGLLRITITRCAPRRLDSDNLQMACSPVRDGIAGWLAGNYQLGQWRDSQNEWAWEYAQAVHKIPGVRIEIDRLVASH